MTDTSHPTYPSLSKAAVLVTGGASGIGAAIVRAYVGQGARVAFLDIDDESGTTLADDTGAWFLPCDLTDIAALRAGIATIEDAWDGLDVLINNAARDDRHEMTQVEPDDWRRHLAINLDHHFFATQAVADGMAAKGGGSVVMVGSVSWMRGRPNMVGYTTAKAAINGLTKTMARELGPKGIRVNCLVPGATQTDRQRALWMTPEAERTILDLQALKFRLQPDHIARLALFLGSADSAGCTGTNFVCDAGLTQN